MTEDNADTGLCSAVIEDGCVIISMAYFSPFAVSCNPKWQATRGENISTKSYLVSLQCLASLQNSIKSRNAYFWKYWSLLTYGTYVSCVFKPFFLFFFSKALSHKPLCDKVPWHQSCPSTFVLLWSIGWGEGNTLLISFLCCIIHCFTNAPTDFSLLLHRWCLQIFHAAGIPVS